MIEDALLCLVPAGPEYPTGVQGRHVPRAPEGKGGPNDEPKGLTVAEYRELIIHALLLCSFCPSITDAVSHIEFT